jgi:Fic family protein
VEIEAFQDSPIGQLVRITGDDAINGPYDHFGFLPDPLPETVDLDQASWTGVAEAAEALGRLRQVCVQLPNPRLLIAPALAREAVSTSALEGTYATLPDVLEARLTETLPSREVIEIRGYEEMADQAFEWVGERAITVGLLCNLQAILARKSKRPTRDPGKIREHQVVVGPEGCSVYDARYVPPPPGDQLVLGLHEWQEWIAKDHDLPVVVRVALAHYQFEALHPFGDGNGRLGRLVMLLQLLCDEALPDPALTISPWFEKRRGSYQDHLLRVSHTGDWNPWVQFVSSALKEQCERHVAVAEELLEWMAELRRKIATRNWGGLILELSEDLIVWPVLSVSWAAKNYKKSFPTAKSAIDRLVEMGVLEEITGRKYRRLFGAPDVMRIVEEL